MFITPVTGSSSAGAIGSTPAVAPANPAPAPQDNVKLSLSAQAQALQSQGLSINEIAQQLGVTVQVVDQCLGIVNNTAGAGSYPTPSEVNQSCSGV
jgi:hypothetical protein